MTMEPVPLPTEDPDALQWDEEDLVEGFLSEDTETATEILDLSNQVKELKEKMEESDFKQSLEAELLILVLEMQTKEAVAHELEETQREVQVRTEKLEEREEQFQLNSRDVEVKRKELELKEKKVEEMMSELEAWEKEQSLVDETIKEKSNELAKREEQFKEAEVKMRSKEKELEEREKLLKGKEKENRKRSLFAENDHHRDEDPPLIHTVKRHKPTREHSHNNDTDLASASSESEREVYIVECIDDGEDEDPEPYNCLDADFNNFNNTMSSFSVGQVWALYDPLDHMPRFYALIRKILKHQQRVEATWLEPVEQPQEPVPIACGEFKYGDKTTRTHLMFSHLMLDHIKKKSIITINPRKGETWALFRDWKQQEKQKRPYEYDFVQVVSDDLDSDDGIGVAYLARVEGFTSVYKLAEQHGVLQMMILSDEMLRFSHRVPSFELSGDDGEEKDGVRVPGGSFELDPAAIPRDYLEGLNVKEEASVGRSSSRSSLGLSLVHV